MGAPKDLFLSVPFATKNGMPYVKATIEGLRRQTYRNFELIVQDGVSTDGTLEYLRSLDEFFPISVVSEPDRNLVEAYGRAWRRSTGDLIVSIACDEVLDPDAFETYVGWYREHPDAVFIYGGSRLVDSAGAVISEFQPPAFNFIKYLQHDMCPTMAGPFNRRVIGEDAYLDETLPFVPDFEILSRLTLKYGDARILRKQAITMSARGDAVSLSFSPRHFMTFAEAKKVVLERMLTGEWRDAFTDYLRRDFTARMHIAFAKQIAALPDGEAAYADHVLAAAEQRVLEADIERLALASRRLNWSPAAGAVCARALPLPETPAPGEPHEALPLTAPEVRTDWAARGARAGAAHGGGVTVTTPGQARQYAAAIPLEIGALDLRSAAGWLRVRVSANDGTAMLALYDRERDIAAHETDLSGPGEVFIELRDQAFDALLIRSGPGRAPTTLTIAGLDLYARPVAGEEPLQVRLGRSRPLFPEDRKLIAAIVAGLAEGDPPKGWERLAPELAEIAASGPLIRADYGLKDSDRPALAVAAKTALREALARAAEPATPIAPRAVVATRLCSGADWQDPEWATLARRLFGAHALTLRQQSRWMWDRVSLAFAQRGRAAGGAVLLVAEAPDTLAPVLLSLGLDVTYATPDEMLAAAAPDAGWKSLIDSSWLTLTGAAHSWAERGQTPFEAMILLGPVATSDPARLESMLAAAAPDMAPGAGLHLTGSVQLNRLNLESAFTLAEWRGMFGPQGPLGARGFTLDGEADVRLPADTLARYAPRDDAEETIPGLSTGYGESLFTSAIVSARWPMALKPGPAERLLTRGEALDAASVNVPWGGPRETSAPGAWDRLKSRAASLLTSR
jgi:glycosyltransferase involved in cell wall biosynthesis